MRKRWIWGAVIVVAAMLLAGAALVGLMAHRYPQREILPQELYGPGQENLQGFTLDDQGCLTAQSSDPWVMFDLGGETDLRQITVYFSQVQDTETAVFYLLPNYTQLSAPISGGRAVLQIPSSLDRHHITGIRFDLTAQAGAVLKVDRVVLNGTLGLAATVGRLMLWAGALLALLAAEAWLWVRLLGRERRERGRLPLANLIAALVQWLLKGGLGLALCRHLVAVDGGDHRQMLCWLLVLGTQCVCLGLVAIRYFDRRRNQLWVMALVPFWAVAQLAGVELLSTARFDFARPGFLALNLLGCCAAAWVLLVVLRWGALALSLSTAAFTLWGVANHYYGAIRGNPLEYSDIAQAGTAVNVLDNYRLAPELLVIAVALAGAVTCVAAFAALGRCCWSWNWRRECCGLAGAVAAALIFGLAIPPFDLGQAWNLSGMSQQYGYLLSFSTCAKASLSHGKPQGYSRQQVDGILGEPQTTKLAQATGQAQPNIIVIMNEAFADLPDLYGFETDVDLLPNIHSLENTITGKLLVSVYGGGTSNTEYEFLTGNSLYTLPVGCCPYVQYLSKPQQSIAWRLQAAGYSTQAYHPYYPSNYQRSSNYPRLGLDPFYSIEDDLPGQEYLRDYLSDSSDYQNVIELYEQRQEDQPFFLFNVTMQNHGSYSTEASRVEVTVKPRDPALQMVPLEEYLSLVHESDQAFRELTDYFSQVEEDTIILMFGDHQPGLGDEVEEALEQVAGGTGDPFLQQNLNYLSSFVIWANFDLEEASEVLASPNYLRAILLDQAGMELNPFEQFLLELWEQYPALNATGYLDSQGQWHYRGDQDQGELQDYAYVVYNNVFDKKHMNEDYFS